MMALCPWATFQGHSADECWSWERNQVTLSWVRSCCSFLSHAGYVQIRTKKCAYISPCSTPLFLLNLTTESTYDTQALNRKHSLRAFETETGLMCCWRDWAVLGPLLCGTSLRACRNWVGRSPWVDQKVLRAKLWTFAFSSGLFDITEGRDVQTGRFLPLTG